MTFTPEYIGLCRTYRSLFRKRRRIRGEWYGNVQTGEVKRYGKEPLEDGASSESEWFYIPELDQLFLFLKNQIMLTQEAVKPAELIVLNYKPDKGWEVVITLENGTAQNAAGGESPHEVLLKVLYGISAFDVNWPDAEAPKVSVIRQRFRELAWRMEMEGDPDLWDDDLRDTRQVIQNVSPEDNESSKKRSGFLFELMEAFRKIVRIRSGKT